MLIIMKLQWLVERKYKKECHENRHWTHKRTLIAPYRFIFPSNLAFYSEMGRTFTLNGNENNKEA